MRLINRTIKTIETKDKLETIITERIVENEELQLQFIKPPQAGETTKKEETMVRCNICTEEFKFLDAHNGHCPACGSKDVNLI